MTVVVMAACVIYGWWVGRDRARAYFTLMLFLTGAIVGVFTAQDLLLFYAFFEAMLIPLYVLIGVWGGAERLRATLIFVVYTVVGSLLMLAAIIVLGLQQGTFDLTQMSPSSSTWLFLGFFVAFAIKSPLFPLHGWLPITYREAPAEVSARALGHRRQGGPLRLPADRDPDTSRIRCTTGVPSCSSLASISLVYGSLLAFRAPDFRGVVMYSSLAQAGLIMLGLFAGNQPRLRRRGAADRQPRADLGDAVPARGHGRAAHVDRRVRLLGGMARGRPALATVVMTAGVIALAVPALDDLRRRVPDPRRRVPAGLGLGGRRRRRRSCSPPCTCCAPISAVLHRDVGSGRARGALDLRLGELAVVVPLLACLIGLSAWPNLITHRAFGGAGRWSHRTRDAGRWAPCPPAAQVVAAP